VFNKEKKIIISGPCSAETEEQLMKTALQIAATGKVDMLRAGIWKPRTKPGMFEGVGADGLLWLYNAKKETGLPIAIEVATSKHVEEALKYSIDMFWIGARTTANPFSVQEIADSLKGVKIPVFVKNPINADLELWSGALERIKKSGIENVGMIHRGFSNYGNKEYRNPPMWHLPIEMKRRHPDMLLLCDPSHICGNRTLLYVISQKAIDLDFDGLMIESHNNPDKAWSDSKQQITPEDLLDIINHLTWRSEDSEKKEFLDALSRLREQIDIIDDEILSLLSHRMKIAEKIGTYKKQNEITIFQRKRWNDIFENALLRKKDLGLSEEFIKKYLEAVHLESISHQNKVMNNQSEENEI
jgi:chorismate mutase